MPKQLKDNDQHNSYSIARHFVHVPRYVSVSKVLLNLARAGHPSSQLDVLISAAGDAAGRDGPALLELLSPSDSAKLLVLLEQAIEEGGLQEEEEGVELEAGRQL